MNERKVEENIELPLEQVADITRVGNIDVGPEFTVKQLTDLKATVGKMRHLFSGKELEKYEGFIAKIEAILEARQQLALQQEEGKGETIH